MNRLVSIEFIINLHFTQNLKGNKFIQNDLNGNVLIKIELTRNIFITIEVN